VENVLDAIKLKRFSIYVQDYGAPVGFRLAVKHPEGIEAIISQNGMPIAPTDLKLPFYSAWPQAQRMMTKRDF